MFTIESKKNIRNDMILLHDGVLLVFSFVFVVFVFFFCDCTHRIRQARNECQIEYKTGASLSKCISKALYCYYTEKHDKKVCLSTK